MIASRIADSIIENLASNKKSAYGQFEIGHGYDLSLKTGLSGISYFLAELYGVTREKKYLNQSVEIGKIIAYNISRSEALDVGILNGLSGIAQYFLKLFLSTQDQSHLRIALRLMKDCSGGIAVSGTPNCISFGRAGFLTVSSAIQSCLKSPQLKAEIDTARILIMQDVHISRYGASWYIDRDKNCCPSDWFEGSLGIASALFSSYGTRDKDIGFLVAQSCKYAKHNIVKVTQELDDILSNRNSGRQKGASGLLKQLVNNYYGFENAQMHFKLLPSEFPKGNVFSRLEEAVFSIAGIRTDTDPSRTMRQHNGDAKNGLGLHDGLAGLGYFHLIQSGLVKLPYFDFCSVKKFDFYSSHNSTTSFSWNFARIVFGKEPYFKGTIFILEKLNADKKNKSLRFRVVNEFENTLARIVKKSKNKILSSIFKLEKAKHQIAKNYDNDSDNLQELYWKAFHFNKKLQALRPTNVLETEFILSDQFRLVTSNFPVDYEVMFRFFGKADWQLEETTYLLFYTGEKNIIGELRLPKEDKIILNFRNSIKPKKLVKVKDEEAYARMNELVLKYAQFGALELTRKKNSKNE